MFAGFPNSPAPLVALISKEIHFAMYALQRRVVEQIEKRRYFHSAFPRTGWRRLRLIEYRPHGANNYSRVFLGITAVITIFTLFLQIALTNVSPDTTEFRYTMFVY